MLEEIEKEIKGYYDKAKENKRLTILAFLVGAFIGWFLHKEK